MNFKKVELIGFKSFSEKTLFLIENGLTGIVGPNGCGKSNIVESIRWCMGENSAKSMRGSGMEDVIFSGTSNKPSKNIAEVSLTLDNSDNDGPLQFKDIGTITLRRKIEKDKGSKYYINDKEVRARDIQTFFADLSTGAHSPSIISQGRIGALVTAKPSDRRAILEEAAGISGIHARKHESELRLNSAENNLKRADELKRQQEKQLENLKKQAEEASKYKVISQEIKKYEAGLYYLKLKEIEKDINSTKEILSESDDEVSGFTIELNHCNNQLENKNSKLKPLRDKNIEIQSKLQRINLELKNLEEEEKRAKADKSRLIKSRDTIESDLDREKNMINDATSNENRLHDEKNNLINTEKTYYELEQKTNSDLLIAAKELNEKQSKLENMSKKLILSDQNKEYLGFLEETSNKLEDIKSYISDGKNEKAINELKDITIVVNDQISKFKLNTGSEAENLIDKLINDIKASQEKYATALSKNQTIKADTVKRQERIKNIDIEVDNWKKLKFDAERMSKNLKDRISGINKDLENISKIPEDIAIRKGQSIQNIANTEEDLKKLSLELNQAEEEYGEMNKSLKIVQEKIIIAREKRARSIATQEGLQNRKQDLVGRINDELNISEDALFDYSGLKNFEKIPSIEVLEKKLNERKQERDSLGSVNLRADEETTKFKETINKMEKDREDLVNAIHKLRTSIHELNQKGRERLLDAFEKVNRKFNEVYTKLFNGGNAKLELVDSDDPLEAGLEMLVSPPGKRLQSITLLSGGEQALTALSLIFAVFLTNPSPICILDEVDAPLDDANVTRFCILLNELIKITRTKFIIVTHHALTMSKMNRLYGITMPEKGISQLVAVDLEKAEELVA